MRARQVGRIALPPATPTPSEGSHEFEGRSVRSRVPTNRGLKHQGERSGKISEMPFEDGVRAVTQSVTLWLVATA